MKKLLTALRAWSRAHKPFLKLVTLVILVGLAANLAFYIYASVTISKIKAGNVRRALETEAYGNLRETLGYYTENPREMEEVTADGNHYWMEKISDAGSPNDTWHVMGWRKTDSGETYRLEGCFAAPPASDDQSN